MRLFIPLSLCLSGCATTFDSTASDTTSPMAESCDAIARTVSPASSGQSNFYYRSDIVFSVTSGGEDAEISLVDSTGSAVSGAQWIDDRVAPDEPLLVRFTPDEPLQAETAYTATLRYCAGSPSVTFQTSSLGKELEEPGQIEGRTFTMDLSAAKVVQPSGAAQVLLTLLDNDLSLQVDRVDGDTLDITVAPTRRGDGEQDTCVPTLDFSMDGNFAKAPAFDVGPVDVPFAVAGYTVMLYDAFSSATFAADGSYFAGGRMSGSVDARDVVIALDGRGVLPSDDPADLCSLLANHNLGCTPCRDGEPLCLDLEVANIEGSQVELDVEAVYDTDCHERCAASCDNSECDLGEDLAVCPS